MDYKKVWEPFLPKGIPKTSSREKVHELNQGEQEEPTEPDTNKSTNETEFEANLIIDTEEEESDKEPNNPNPVEGSANLKPKVELEEETIKLSVEPKFTTPMPTSEMLSLRHGQKILTMQVKMVLKKTRGMS
ncbi:hypothetical protein J1N35_007926 [Gossypium stocksii]|uniref:Uncharacterized protein n=1 Tax=Gossypium stocksii TaxID=47602 RepID=A0A9D3W8C2_9ROSI|nr:hypothetical protein J1N35_007926 [Gossypium stocksii]